MAGSDSVGPRARPGPPYLPLSLPWPDAPLRRFQHPKRLAGAAWSSPLASSAKSSVAVTSSAFIVVHSFQATM